MTKYRQCELRRRSFNGVSYDTYLSWVPEKYAVAGEVLKIRSEDGAWVDGWVVRAAYPESTDEPEHFPLVRRMHRRNTGDSMPKQKTKA